MRLTALKAKGALCTEQVDIWVEGAIVPLSKTMVLNCGQNSSHTIEKLNSRN